MHHFVRKRGNDRITKNTFKFRAASLFIRCIYKDCYVGEIPSPLVNFLEEVVALSLLRSKSLFAVSKPWKKQDHLYDGSICVITLLDSPHPYIYIYIYINVKGQRRVDLIYSHYHCS